MAIADDLVTRLEVRLRPLENEALLAVWNANTASSEATEARQKETDLALREVLADAEAFAAVQDALARPASPATRRQLDVLRRWMQPNQIDESTRTRLVELETGAQAIFNTHRGEIDGRRVDDNEILRILTESDDSNLRRRAWEASKSVGAAAVDSLLDLVRLRNQAARGLGYRDHYDLALSLDELDEDRLMATLDQVERLTDEPFRAWKADLDVGRAARFGCRTGDLRPWHYDDPFFQDVPRSGALDLDAHFSGADLEAVTLRTYDGLGIDMRPVLAASDLYARDAKCQHAFCLNVDRERDVRVLSNNVPGERWMETMLHEFGHAAYEIGLGPDVPFLLRGPAHMLTTEAVAMLFGSLTRRPEWLASVGGLSGPRLEQLAPALAAGWRGARLVFARWALVMVHFERGLYRDPDADHTDQWWKLVERFQLVHRPDGRTAPDWAAKIHLAMAPVYYQNYLFGELLAAQLGAALQADTGALVERPAVGQWLTEQVFRPGATLRWDDLVKEATGRALEVTDFAEACAG